MTCFDSADNYGKTQFVVIAEDAFLENPMNVAGNLAFLFKKYIQDHHPPEVYQSVSVKLDEQARSWIDSGILSSKFYPLKEYQQLIQGYYQSVPLADFLKSAEFQAQQQLSGIYRLLSRMLSKESLIKHMSQMWQKAYDSGKLELIKDRGEAVGVRVLEFEFNEAHQIHFQKYVQTLLKIASKTNHSSSIRKINQTTTEFYFTPQQS